MKQLHKFHYNWTAYDKCIIRFFCNKKLKNVRTFNLIYRYDMELTEVHWAAHIFNSQMLNKIIVPHNSKPYTVQVILRKKNYIMKTNLKYNIGLNFSKLSTYKKLKKYEPNAENHPDLPSKPSWISFQKRLKKWQHQYRWKVPKSVP